MTGNSRVSRLEIVQNRLLSRRAVLRNMALGGAGLAAGSVLAACGSDGAGDTSADSSSDSSTDSGSSDSVAAAGVTDTTFAYSFPAPHAGIFLIQYAAQKMGFWEEEGLNTEITYQTAVAPLLAGGTVAYAEAAADELLNAFSAGQPLVAVYQPTYGQQFGFAVPVDSPITEWSAADLDGTTIGITELAGGEVPVARAALSRIGFTEGDQVSFFPTSGANQAITVDAFNTDTIQVFAGSILDIAAVEAAGIEMRSITPQFVIEASGDNAISVRRDYLEENRDEVVRWCRGMAKAKVWASANREVALDLAYEVAPDTGPREETEGFLDIIIWPRLLPPPEANIEEGAIWEKGWSDFQDLLLEGGTGSPDDPLTFTEPIAITEIIDNSLIGEIFDFDRAEIEARTP